MSSAPRSQFRLASGVLARCAAGVGLSCAAAAELSFVSEPVGPEVGDKPWIAHLQMVDLDQDGRLDLVSCDAKANEVLWLRQSSPGEFDAIVLAREIPACVRTETVDFDGDGDLDLLVASMGEVFPTSELIGSIHLFENDGQQGFTSRILAAGLPRVTDVRVADLNGNGRMDLAVAGFGYSQGEVCWLENRGDGTFTHHSLLRRSGAVNVVIAELTGDGLPDIAAIVSQEWEEVHLFENAGGSFVGRRLWGAANEDFGSSGLNTGDLNRDGRIDLVFTNGDGFDLASPGSRRWHGVQWLENLGGGTFRYHRIADLKGAYTPVVADLDTDGWPDIAVVATFNEWEDPESIALAAFMNKGKAGFEFRPLANRPTHLLALAAGDLDGTGDPVLVTGGFHAYPPFDHMSRICLWRQSEEGSSPALATVSAAASSGWRRDAEVAAASRPVREEYGRRVAELEGDPDAVEPLAELALFYHANGFAEAALELYAALAEAQPESARWPYLAETLHQESGALEKALSCLGRALKRDPQMALGWWRRGELLDLQNDGAGAERAWRRALELQPTLVHAQVGLARLALRAGDLERAEIWLRKAMASDPELSSAYALLAEVYRKGGDEEAARRVEALPASQFRYRDPVDAEVDRLWAHAYNLRLLRIAADAAFTSLQTKRARTLLKRALEVAPEEVDTLLALAKVELADERMLEARSLLDRVIARSPERAEAHYILAFEWLRAGETGEALRVAQGGVARCPEDAALQRLLSQCYLKQGNAAAAEAACRRAVELAPDNAVYLTEWADRLRDIGETGRAIEVWERARAADPRALRARLMLADVYQKSKEIEQALTCLEEAQGIAPRDLQVLEQRCALLLRAGRLSSALAGVESFLRIDASVAKAHYLRGALLRALGQEDAAAQALAQARRLAVAAGDAALVERIQKLNTSTGGDSAEGLRL